MKEPKAPYRDVEDARQQVLNCCTTKDRAWITEVEGWPCPSCHGCGQRYGWSDPYEGTKLADLERCSQCDGHGILSKGAFAQWYEDRMAPHWAHLDTYKQLELEVRWIFSKLSDDEIQTLTRWFGID